MSSRQFLTLKYRPQTFAELLIQDHVRDTLTRALERNRLANAYLFAGPRGVGKTTAARILAKCLNCLESELPTPTPCNRCTACVEIAASRSMDVIEVDGASNRGIDEVRELRENIRYTPSNLRFRVYIIDEVHMLTQAAFNALLKTLEEPPAHAKFIFATTEAHQVPMTILSRCQRFEFRKATPAEIVDRLRWLAERENIRASSDALAAIAHRADGALRDAESLLDQLSSYAPEGIELAHVEDLLGLVPAGVYDEYTRLLLAGDAAGLIQLIDRLFTSGSDVVEFYSGLVDHFRNLLLIRVAGPAAATGLLPEEQARLKEQASCFDGGQLMRILGYLCDKENMARRSLMPRVVLELVSVELAAARQTPEPTADPERPAAGNPDPGPSARHRADRPASLETVWSNLRSELDKHHPLLAGALELAEPVSWSAGVLRISLPVGNTVMAERLSSCRPAVEAALTSVVGRPARIEVTTGRAEGVGSDATLDGIREVFGDAEET
uniref:DNA polymerase III subunit gamma/tau n=1 Tax=candidate division WOR-3 bacterium TaxID=2052148 RepID=A0A7C4GGA0_UNCW3